MAHSFHVGFQVIIEVIGSYYEEYGAMGSLSKGVKCLCLEATGLSTLNWIYGIEVDWNINYSSNLPFNCIITAVLFSVKGTASCKILAQSSVIHLSKSLI
jgi:hypothetical protein